MMMITNSPFPLKERGLMGEVLDVLSKISILGIGV
jgi:hypothetical protein